MILALAGLLALPAAGQPAARVLISAPSSTVLSGTTLQLTAAAFSSQDQLLPNAPITWSSSSTSSATVDARGLVTGLGLGTPKITAASGNARGEVYVQVLPQRVEVLPPRAEIGVGEKLTFSAKAYDVAGKEITPASFRWNLYGSGAYQVAQLGQPGELTGRTVGETIVRATVDYGQSPVATTIGPIGDAAAKVTLRSAFDTVRRLSTEDVGHSFLLRGLTGNAISVNDTGEVAFVANLSGLANATLVFDGESMRLAHDASAPMASSGFGCCGRGYVGPPRIRSNGDVLISTWSGLHLASAGGLEPVLVAGISADGAESIQLNGRSSPVTNERGDVAFLGWFRSAGRSEQSVGLFRLMGATGELQLLWSDEIPLPEGPPGFDVRHLAIDGAGAVYVTLGGSQPALYAFVDRGDARRIAGVGDALDGSEVSWVHDAAAGEDGRLVYAVDLDRRATRLVSRWPDGRLESVTIGGFGGIHSVHPKWGVLFNGAMPGGSWGVLRWSPSGVSSVLRHGAPAANGEPIRNVRGAFHTGDGEVIVLAELAETTFAVLRVGGGERRILFAEGSRVDVTASLALDNGSLVRGHGGGGPYVVLGWGGGGSLHSLEAGGLSPRLVTGDSLPDGARLDGINDAVEAAGGVLVLTNGGRLYRVGEDGVTRLAPDRPELGFGSPMAANAAGKAVLLSYSGEDTWIVSLEGGALSTLARLERPGAPGSDSPTAGRFAGVHALAVDGSGRVLATLEVSGGRSGHFLHVNGGWQPVPLPAGVDEEDGGLWDHRAFVAGVDRFFGRFQDGPGGGYIAELADASGWKVIIPSGMVLPDGRDSGRFFSGAAAGASGELLVEVGSGGSTMLLLRSSGSFRPVASAFESIGEGDVFLRGTGGDVSLRADGRIFFVAELASGHRALYEARPR